MGTEDKGKDKVNRYRKDFSDYQELQKKSSLSSSGEIFRHTQREPVVEKQNKQNLEVGCSNPNVNNAT